MSKYRWGFFPFDTANYKAAQAYLDKKAETGWVLDRLYLRRLARFVPAEGRTHCVDLCPQGIFDDGPDPEYLQLCQDAGWELVKRAPEMLLFRSKPGEYPAPIQSDSGMEGERFWKRFVRKRALTSVALILALALILWTVLSLSPDSFKPSALFVTSSAPLYLLVLCFAAVLLVWQLISLLVSYRRWHASGTFSSKYRSAWTWGVLWITFCALWIAVALFGIAEEAGLGKTVDILSNPIIGEDTAAWEVCGTYPVLLSRDLGLDSDGSHSRSLEGHRSLLVETLTYDELYDELPDGLHFLTTERYDCAWAWTARALLAARRGETARAGDIYYDHLAWSPAPGLGFDESWTTESGSYLLFREGKTVALVGAPGFDLTEPDTLAIVRQRLLPGE